MTQDRWQRVKALFQMTVDRPPSERAAFLAAAADGDEPLQRDVESLLSADSLTEHFTDGLPIVGGVREAGSAVSLAVLDATSSPAVLTAGLVVGSYAVVGPLGVGGMGEVYRARDSKLNRDVALKVLQPRIALDPTHLARFQREAQVLAALNHPNIAAIYGLEESHGHQALVLELVEGPTLADRVARGPLPLHEALMISRQLAEALKAAHKKGIVHRDLKPANIKITPANVVKVLDFGLAKAGGSDSSETASSRSSSLTASGTQDGVVLGTAAYMSPEQTRGHAVDQRADIWAFGCVLFEMLTGRRAFEGDTLSRTSRVVLEERPDWHALPATTPAAARRLLQRCLEKDVALRQRDMTEVLSTIEGLVAAGHESSRRGSMRRWALALGTLTLGVTAVIGYIATRTGPAPSSVGPSPRLAFRQLTSQPGIEWFPNLSPDRQWLVYAGEASGNRDIYLQSLTSRSAINLTADSQADDDQPAFSPDGEGIAFRSERDGGGIFVMNRTGQGVRQLTRTGYRPAWSPDGRQIAYISNNVELNIFNARGPFDLWAVDVNSGRSRPLLEESGPRPGVAQAAWSPRGTRLAVTLGFASSRLTDIGTVAVGGGPATTIVSGPATDWNPTWSPDGRYVYFTSDRGGSTNLWRIAVDETTGKAVGEPEPITVPSPFVAHPAISTSGRDIVFSSVSITMNVVRMGFDPSSATVSGEPREVTTGSRAWANPDPSPDGEWVAFYSRENPEGHVYVSRADGSELRQLTHDEAVDRVPRWSPDGRWITFFSTRGNAGFRFWGIHPDGSGLRQFTDVDSLYPVWSPDGTRMAVSMRSAPWVVGNPVGAVVEPKVFVFDPARPWNAQTPEELPQFLERNVPYVVNDWSLDGRMLAGQPGLGSTGIATYSFGTRTYQRLTNFGEFPSWLPDSRHILFLDGTGKHFLVLDTVTGQSRRVFSVGRNVIGPPRLTRDGRTAFFSQRVTEADIWLLTFDADPLQRSARPD